VHGARLLSAVSRVPCHSPPVKLRVANCECFRMACTLLAMLNDSTQPGGGGPHTTASVRVRSRRRGMDTGALCSGGDAYAHNAPARNARRRVRRAISLVWQRTVRRSVLRQLPLKHPSPTDEQHDSTSPHVRVSGRGGRGAATTSAAGTAEFPRQSVFPHVRFLRRDSPLALVQQLHRPDAFQLESNVGLGRCASIEHTEPRVQTLRFCAALSLSLPSASWSLY
jgi:hypothetical protein